MANNNGIDLTIVGDSSPWLVQDPASSGTYVSNPAVFAATTASVASVTTDLFPTPWENSIITITVRENRRGLHQRKTPKNEKGMVPKFQVRQNRSLHPMVVSAARNDGIDFEVQKISSQSDLVDRSS